KKNGRWLEKITHVVAVVTIVFLTHAVVYAQWLIPFYYAISTPVLIAIRIIMYWIPDVGEYFAVVFGIANGPVLWAMVVYRNSAVFHSLDKMTSTYIHVLPSLLSFGIRWQTEDVSKYWFKDFVPTMPEMSVIWLGVLPFACFFFHSLLYMLVMHCLAVPGDEYITSFSYLGKKETTCLFKMFNVFGKRWRPAMFYVFNYIFCILSLTGVFLAYYFYIAHCVLIALLSVIVIFYGGQYYVDVFSVRGFNDVDDGN
ncbi:hypothetical protein FSP39_005766, partial [Pinctada imbricata]